jgi:hypothetical protein
MMQKTVRFSAIAAMTLHLSVAILISVAHYNVAQAQDNPKLNRTAAACGNELRNKCGGGVAGTQLGLGGGDVLHCFRKVQATLPARCAALARNVVRHCDADANRLCQGVVTGLTGNIVGCLTMARNAVSPRCNAALDAAFLR